MFMYSYEIDNYLRERNWDLTPHDYGIVCDIKTSPQICRIQYDAFIDVFHMWTNDGYHWMFRIVNNE